MRPRLVLSLEQQIQKNIDRPDLRLRGAEGLSDARRQSAERRQGSDRRLVRARLGGAYVSRRALRSRGAPAARASGGDARHGLRRDAEKSRSTARWSSRRRRRSARMRVAERAYTLLKSEAHSEAIEDWVASQRGGPDMALVFEAANGASLDTVRVPAFFTYRRVLSRASRPHADDRRQAAEGELGARRRRATRAPSSSNMRACSRTFSISTARISSRRGTSRSAICSCARCSATSRNISRSAPLRRRLRRSSRSSNPIRDETALTRERKGAAGERQGAARQASAAQMAASRLGSTSAQALDLAMKSQRKAGDPPPEVPGASIEANFKPFQILRRRRGRLAADRRAARQSQRTLSPA